MKSRLLARAIGRPLGRPTPATLRDAARRGAHVLRHSRVVRPSRTGDVFNLDLHVSVIADVRTQLDRRGISLVDWTVSGHSWVAGRPRDPVAVVNERTFSSYGPRLARRFRRAYGSYLDSFRGFVAAYPPGFALLYEGFAKPTLAVAATRYEWPFTHHASRWDWLDTGLRAGVDDGWLTLVANNRADADYLRHYSGLDAAAIPSACTYTGLTYTGRRPSIVICTSGRALAEEAVGALRHEAVPLRSALGARYEQADLYDYRALVLLPYNVSLMALFEHYTACAPVYVPARVFLKDLMQRHPADVLSSLSFCQVTGKPPARRPARLDLNDTTDERVVDWYLDRADFYDDTWMPHVRQFESWDHLDELLATDDPREISARMADERPERLRRIAALWDGLAWFAALAEPV
jgi:hypothetical protein